MRDWQLRAAALSGGPGRNKSRQLSAEVLEPSHTEHRAVIFFFFSSLEAKIVKQ